jgi:hypothetical protein
MDPLFEDLHRDPRFARLRMLLPARQPAGTQKR